MVYSLLPINPIKRSLLAAVCGVLVFVLISIFLIEDMPPKIGSHSKEAQHVADGMYDYLTANTTDGASFSSAVLAFADKPGVVEALGFPKGAHSVDVVTGASLLSNIRQTFGNTLASSGPRHLQQRQIAEGTASALVSPDINFASTTRITGISRDVLNKGLELRVANAAAAQTAVASSIERSTNKHAYPLDKVHEWFHTSECTGVQINKQTKRQY